MELTQLYYFETLARMQHFTKAAQELHISQPSLSKSIGNLEDELGVQLFERVKKKVYINKYGETLLMHVKNIKEEISRAKAEIDDLAIGAHGEIFLAASFFFAEPNPLYYFYRDFVLNHPEISMHIYMQSNEQMVRMLKDRRIDFYFSFFKSDDIELEWEYLDSSRLGIVVSKDHPLAGKKSIRLEELKDEKFMCNNQAPDLHDSVYYLCHQAGFEPNVIFEGDAEEIIGEAVSRGMGVAFSSQERNRLNAKKKEKKEWEKNLAYLEVENDFCERTLGIQYMKDRHITAAHKLFLDELRRAMKARVSVMVQEIQD